ncbi:MAG: adenosylmethionine decarboxylase [Candidatus Bipolaricaulota bacterium]|nr:adenosylmethionine decarboxylase [Candidatus Bipolaricaulota bacterium]
MRGLGRQLVVEMWDCARRVDDPAELRAALEAAVKRAGATLIDVQVHPFNPHGASGMALLAESHISFHTWPELGYVALDVFTCGDRVRPEEAVRVFQDLFAPQKVSVVEIRRGVRP